MDVKLTRDRLSWLFSVHNLSVSRINFNPEMEATPVIQVMVAGRHHDTDQDRKAETYRFLTKLTQTFNPNLEGQ